MRAWLSALLVTATALAPPALAPPAAAQETRDHVSLVGPRNLYPIMSAMAEEFGRRARYKYPRLATMDASTAIQLLCAGPELDKPDAALANRAMTESENRRCQRNGVVDLVNLKVGYEALAVVAGAPGDAAPAGAWAGLRASDLFLAMAAEVPDRTTAATADTLGIRSQPNPHRRWKELNPTLPDLPIRLVIPPRTSILWSLLQARVLDIGCRAVPEIAAQERIDPAGVQRQCRSLREDDAIAEDTGRPAGLPLRLAEPGTLSFLRLDQARALGAAVQLLPVDAVEPEPANLDGGLYKPSQPVHLFVKRSNFQITPGLREMVTELIEPRAIGPDGYLTAAGLVPLPRAEREQAAVLVTAVTAPPDPVTETATTPAADAAARLRTVESDLWARVGDAADPETVRLYLDVFPEGLYARTARERIARLAAPPSRATDGAVRLECPGSAPLTAGEGCWAGDRLLFAVGEDQLRPEHTAVLDRLAALLLRHPTLRLDVTGHTDTDGTATANTRYAARRASATAEYLMAKGIAADRLEVRGMSAEQPVAPNDTAENRQLNRRVELRPAGAGG